MLTRDLKKSNDNMVVHGKLILNLSTNLTTPISQANTAGAARPAQPPVPSTNGVATQSSNTPAAQATASLHPETSNLSTRPSTSQRSSMAAAGPPPGAGPVPAPSANGARGG